VNALLDSNLIRLFDFYLLLIFVIGLIRRWAMYKDILILAGAAVLRRPNLVREIGAHRHVLMTRQTVIPVALALLLMAVQFVMSRLIWPEATVSLRDETSSWWRFVLIVATFVPMLAVDIYFLVRIGQIDRTEAIKQLNRAEHWLTSWQGTAVKWATLGYVDPKKMVHDQLRDGLTWFGGLVAWSMWWVVVQVTLRVAFGLTVWLLWAFLPVGGAA
jgi:hypothetical protein